MQEPSGPKSAQLVMGVLKIFEADAFDVFTSIFSTFTGYTQEVPDKI